MTRNDRLLAATLATCMAGLAVITVVQLLDRNGHLDPRRFGGHVLMMASPFAGIAALAVGTRALRDEPAVAMCFALIALGLILCGFIGDSLACSRTQSGEDELFSWTLPAWVACWLLVAFLTITSGIAWTLRRWSRP